MEQRKSYKDAKGKAQVGQTPTRLNTDTLYDGGHGRSSDEASVMGVERRTEVIQQELPLATMGYPGRDNVQSAKSVPITQQMVWKAYRKVRSNKGAAGIDKQSIREYEENLEDNLYILWNRLSSGSYFPPAVLEVEIPKDDGKKRRLGIPTVSDRVAQQVVKNYLEPRFEVEFSPFSYGYRPRKSAHQALTQVRANVRKYRWAVDMDIKGFFDNMSHELLQKALVRHVKETWVLMYIHRWLNAPIETEQGEIHYRSGKGTPQGGVISPLLANLFLHYAFDKWFSIKHPTLRFVRYADDLVIHCRTQQEAEEVLQQAKDRMQECELEAHEKKTKMIYCKDANRSGKYSTVKFDFLGFSFQPRPTANVRNGVMFLGFDCAISKKSEKKICEVFRKSRFHLWSDKDVTYIADYFNPRIRGWINYYGKFRKHKLMRIFRFFHNRLLKWVKRKYKRIRNSYRIARQWLSEMLWKHPKLFVHWQYGFGRA